jgi:hypothetical protein
MRGERSYDVLLISLSEYRIDGAFRYTSGEVPKAGAVIKIVDETRGQEREARVRRVNLEASFPIHATDLTPLPPERWVAPRERQRRQSKDEAKRILDARRGWLNRRRSRAA